MTERTNWPLIASRLRSETFIRHVERHGEIASTNDRALVLATDADLPIPALVLADRQTAGRGRGGNIWQSGPGSLTFSVIVERPDGLGREQSSLLSLAAGLAVRDAVAEVACGHEIKVKWPNDVYLANPDQPSRKLGGILSEIASGNGDRVVIGVGLNANNSLDDAPADIRRRSVSLFEALGRRCELADLLVDVLVRLESELNLLATAGGLPAGHWSPHCLLTGREVRLRTPAGEFAGHCLGVADNGALMLEGSEGLQLFHGGEVVAF